MSYIRVQVLIFNNRKRVHICITSVIYFMKKIFFTVLLQIFFQVCNNNIMCALNDFSLKNIKIIIRTHLSKTFFEILI